MKNPRNAGRKPKYLDGSQKMSMRMPHKLHDRLVDEAARSGKPKTEVVIDALDAALPGGKPKRTKKPNTVDVFK